MVLAGIDDKSVISRKPLLGSEQRDGSPRVQDGPGWIMECCAPIPEQPGQCAPRTRHSHRGRPGDRQVEQLKMTAINRKAPITEEPISITFPQCRLRLPCRPTSWRSGAVMAVRSGGSGSGWQSPAASPRNIRGGIWTRLVIGAQRHCPSTFPIGGCAHLCEIIHSTRPACTRPATLFEHRIEHRVPGIFDRAVVIAEDSRKRL